MPHVRAFWQVVCLTLVVDAALLAVGACLNWPQSWLLAIPVLAVNLPAIPLAILYSAVLDEPISRPLVIWLFVSEAIVSSLVWGWLGSKIVKRRMRIQQAMRGFPIELKAIDEASK